MRVRRVLLLLAALYPSWLAMMTVHELGHVLHGWLSGATVSRVHLPLLGFSLTEFSINPHPHFVAWGGVVWGCLLPLLAWALCARPRRRVRGAAQFIAGFCLIANGAYLAAGWKTRAGDAGDLLDYGTPAWAMFGVGMTMFGAGMYLWHRLVVHRTSIDG